MRIGRFIARRALAVVPVALAVIAATFAMIHLVPGDPVVVIMGVDADPQRIAEAREALGLDRADTVPRLSGRRSERGLGHFILHKTTGDRVGHREAATNAPTGFRRDRDGTFDQHPSGGDHRYQRASP